MSRVFNFGAGPATLPDEVLEQARAELTDYRETGMSVMEMPRRDSDFRAIAQQAEADLREFMDIPPNYKVLFLQGGAQAKFAMVALNMLGSRDQADYVDTGHWTKRAVTEASRF